MWATCFQFVELVKVEHDVPISPELVLIRIVSNNTRCSILRKFLADTAREAHRVHAITMSVLPSAD